MPLDRFSLPMRLSAWLTWRMAASTAPPLEGASTSRRADRGRSRARWLRPGEPVTIAGYRLSAGLVYVGSQLPALCPRVAIEPALIDPELPVNRRNPDDDGEHLSYWPSYSCLHAESRAAYLRWLANDRQGEIAIGYVFLFFYGLERRALADAPLSPRAAADLPWIAQEVRALLERYGHDPSFASYARAFLEIVETLVVRHADAPASRATRPQRRERLARGPAVSGKPLPADVALAWLQSLPDVWRHAPARDYPHVLAQIFTREYAARYGEGIELPHSNVGPTVAYAPASASFGGALAVSNPELSEADGDHYPQLTELVELADACAEQLERYRAASRAASAAAAEAAPARVDLEPDGGSDAGLDSLPGMAPATGPVVVRPARTRRRSQCIPTPPRLPRPTRPLVTLDARQVRARIVESAEVAALLASVFTDDEPPPTARLGPPAQPPSRSTLDSALAIDGLDHAHAALVHALAAQAKWSRADVDAAAAAQGLLPAGAIDTVNEHAIDRAGEPLCEPDGDCIAINAYALEELLS